MFFSLASRLWSDKVFKEDECVGGWLSASLPPLHAPPPHHHPRPSVRLISIFQKFGMWSSLRGLCWCECFCFEINGRRRLFGFPWSHAQNRNSLRPVRALCVCVPLTRGGRRFYPTLSAPFSNSSRTNELHGAGLHFKHLHLPVSHGPNQYDFFVLGFPKSTLWSRFVLLCLCVSVMNIPQR